MKRTTPLSRARRLPYFSKWWLFFVLLLSACGLAPQPSEPTLTLPAQLYFDKVHGAWQATMVANHTGLLHEGKYLAEPSPANSIELIRPEQWSTDDDTAVEWVDLHILETDGLDPTYAQIRDQWVDHLLNPMSFRAIARNPRNRLHKTGCLAIKKRRARQATLNLNRPPEGFLPAMRVEMT